jgi:hypothetical protein
VSGVSLVVSVDRDGPLGGCSRYIFKQVADVKAWVPNNLCNYVSIVIALPGCNYGSAGFGARL